MVRLFLFMLVALPLAGFAQEKGNLMKVSAAEFDSFPGDSAVTQKVFNHYYTLGFATKEPDSLNDAQKTLCLHFICNGLIDNSGFYSILLETNGDYNDEYAESLGRIGDTKSKKIIEEIASVYEKYESWLSRQINPPALDENSEQFDEKLANKLDDLQEEWLINSPIQDALFNEFLKRHKLDLVEK